jgi:hypothetical protein
MIRRVIETLRLPKKNGIAASLMDYARFNYIAQPGDKGVRFTPDGALRSLCSELGYRVIPNLSPKQKFHLTSGFWKSGRSNV